MTHTFKIRYANVLVGSLVLLVLALLVVATIFIGAKKQWFKNPFTIEAELPFRRSLGLKQGTSVFLMDSVAGEVSALHYHHDGHITATLTFKDIFKNFIRTNAVGIVRKEFAVMGEQRIVLSQKEEGPTYADIETVPPLQIQPDVDVIAALLKTADRVSSDVPELVADARVTVSNLMALTSQLSDKDKGVQPALIEVTAAIKKVRDVLETVQNGQGIAAKALNDPAFAASIQKAIDGLAATLADVRTTLAKVQTLSDKVPPVLDSVKGTLDSAKTLADDARPLIKTATESAQRVPQVIDHADVSLRQLPSILSDAQATLEDLQLLLQGLQRNWLLRGGVEKAKQEQLDNARTNAVLFYP
jgi:phospholipid/cholesterol/gamma-HCH transport system substrate-binding protein